MLALLVLGLGLVFVAGPAYADDKVLDFDVQADGVAGGSCQSNGSLLLPCTSNSGSDTTGEAIGKHIGHGAWTLSVSTNTTTFLPNGPSGGRCWTSSGTGQLAAANGDIINFNTVGLLCEEVGSGSSYQYNGSFRIVPGTGRFSAAQGGGAIDASFNRPASTSFMKMDGAWNF
jgi:hypothetical protein